MLLLKFTRAYIVVHQDPFILRFNTLTCIFIIHKNQLYPYSTLWLWRNIKSNKYNKLLLLKIYLLRFRYIFTILLLRNWKLFYDNFNKIAMRSSFSTVKIWYKFLKNRHYLCGFSPVVSDIVFKKKDSKKNSTSSKLPQLITGRYILPFATNEHVVTREQPILQKEQSILRVKVFKCVLS